MSEDAPARRVGATRASTQRPSEDEQGGDTTEFHLIASAPSPRPPARGIGPGMSAHEAHFTVDPAHLARLARLALPPDELAALTRDLERILGYVGELEALDLTNVPPTRHPLDLQAPARADVPTATLPLEAALSGAKNHDSSAFIVPKVV